MDPSRPPLRPLSIEDGPIAASQGGSGSVLTSLSIAYQFDDYKRRHTKQNRDIIRENAKRLLETRILQDEITELHQKLLLERAGRSAMGRELIKAKEELARVRNTSAIEALSTILSAVPSLHSLHRQLTLTPSVSTSSYNYLSGRDPIIEWQARPLVASAGIPELEMVIEGNESDGTSAGGNGYGMGRRRSRTPSEEVRLRSKSPQAPPPTLTTAISHHPSNANSPTPPRRSPRKPVPKLNMDTEPPPARSNGRGGRRQSGLFVSRAPSKSPEVQEGASASTSGRTDEVAMAPVQRRRRRSEMTPPDLEKRVIPGGEEGVETPNEIVEGIDRLSGATVGKEVHEMEKVDEVREEGRTGVPEFSVMPSTRGGSPAPSAVSADMDANADPNGDGRNRRARKSVNYREPSLHTKMRKPDGTSSSFSDSYVARPLDPSSQNTGRSRSTTPLGSSVTPARTMDVLSEVTVRPSRPESPTSQGKGEDFVKSMIRPMSVGVQNKLDAAGVAGSMRRKSVVPRSKRELGMVGDAVGGSLRAEWGRESPVERGEIPAPSRRQQPARRASVTVAARESAVDRSASASALTASSKPISPIANRRPSPPVISSTKGPGLADDLEKTKQRVSVEGADDGSLTGRKGRRQSSMFQGGGQGEVVR